MNTIEFESTIKGNMLEIPAQFTNHISGHQYAKIILMLPEKKISPTKKNIKNRLIEIGKHCASLPLSDNRTPDEILGYNHQGIPA
jgi:hypothetical protein